MRELTKVLYIVVVDEGEKKEETSSFRYTRSVLQSTLQLMGCKALYAFKQKDDMDEIYDEVAEIIKEDLWPNPLTYLNNDADEEDFDGDEEGKDDSDNDGEGEDDD
ncbi:hypothetical protein V6N13_148271 [Hibiscus sabdariffa]|uniref:Uncharacterized protein n=1 Tax=Hibiscus sabdariffa TaxID=183260 RepID=A0ABR2TYS4_9ROSI